MVQESSARRFKDVLVGMSVAASIVTPILLGSPTLAAGDASRPLYLSFVVWVMSGMFAWRAGAAVGAGGAIVIAVTTLFLSSVRSHSVLLDFVAMLMAVSAVVLLDTGFLLKFAVVALIGIVSAALHRSVHPFAVVGGAALSTGFLTFVINLIKAQAEQTFSSIRGIWYPVITYVSSATGIVLIFAFWYKWAYLYWPDTAFDGIHNTGLNAKSGWIASMSVFIYQALCIFATEGPPFPPGNSYTRVLVCLQIACSVLLVGVFLNLLINRIGQTKKEPGQ